MGTWGALEGVLSAFAQKRINSTRSNGLTAKRAHRGPAPRGREGPPASHASTLSLSRQGAARPCALPADLRVSSLGRE
ncbi:hypothetical protein P7K49_024316 [Saguinus oedipus]|uniref:Uncharacterized protein n=1 Tax=Saguinus oedipus TaxID=9490 RepID=A0ABQ9UQ00_SAGOE|nr:hypothetical protein P7K49_024316 [Saguinus oedipus]